MATTIQGATPLPHQQGLKENPPAHQRWLQSLVQQNKKHVIVTKPT